ncbi:hypothetical protein [Algoriphagus litoralis]|uniref:hypothetical protein n=1 Tax=Algoriphagus litoralis TaxID=2202829 RepID=UPI0013009B4A|nr:hypothetical protein [Algoriphagus litoralis]
MRFNELRDKCESYCRITDPVLTEIMYYGAVKSGLDTKFSVYSKRYKHIVSKWDEANWSRFKSQYIVHEIFKNKKLISSYLNHSQIKALPQETFSLLHALSEEEWRYTFWQIQANPAPDFFWALDLVSLKEFLLFSPGVSAYLKTGNPKFFGGLIHPTENNCFQTFGPLVSYLSMDADDLFYFAAEVDPLLYESGQDIADIISDELFMFLLLAAFGHIPAQIYSGYELVFVSGEVELEDIDFSALSQFFTIEYNPPIVKIVHKEYGEFPHYANAYFHEEQQVLYLSSMTDYGYEHLISDLERLNLPIDAEPQVRLHLSMKMAVEEIFRKKVEMMPYEKHFVKDTDASASSSIELEKLNHFLQRLMPLLNSKKEVDIDRLIDETGAEPESAKKIYIHIRQKLGF